MRNLLLTAAIGGAVLLAGCGDKQKASVPDAGGATAAADKSPAEIKAMLATLPAPYATADVADGERQSGQCRSCHSFAKDGANLTGPHLWNVVGRKAGSLEDYKYSDALKASGLTWDAPTLDKWIEHPRSVVPETKMSFFGLKNAEKRANLIAYLRTRADK